MNITMPDFDEWARSLWGVDEDVATALKQAFDQGRSLGYREGELKGQKHILDLYHSQSNAFIKNELGNMQEWWEQQDNDDAWIDAQEATQEKLEREEVLVQVFNPKNKLYYLINKSSGTMGEVGSRTMHMGIRIITSPKEV